MRADGVTYRSRHIPFCESRFQRYGKKRGWSTHRRTQVRSRCGNYGCDGHQGAITCSIILLDGPELLNDFAEQGKLWKHEHQPSLPVL